MKKVIVVYEKDENFFGENKANEIYKGEFASARAVADWIKRVEKQTTSRQNINKAIKEGYIVLDKYLIFRLNKD